MNIIFEGIDGVGKTTIINNFREDLESKKEIDKYILQQEKEGKNVIILSEDIFK